jgi:4-amino-4-deoxy-L-arabinose transferase-like glycosyltransferase
LWAFEKPSIKRFILSGVLIAITNLCRPTAALFPALVLLLMPWAWSWKCKIRLFLAYISAIIIVTAPWVYHNYQTHHAFLPYSVSVGALWQGSPEFYHLVTDQKRNLLQIWQEQLNAERNGGHDPFSIEGDRYFTKRAIASIKAEPGLYARYCLQKAAYFWIGNPVIDWPGQALFNVKALSPYFSPQRIVGIFFARLLPLVALVALIILRRDFLKFIPLLAFCAYFMVIHAITYSEVRYSEPLYPIIVTLIATAAGEIQRRYESAVKYS